jgi:hypothetical protein
MEEEKKNNMEWLLEQLENGFKKFPFLKKKKNELIDEEDEKEEEQEETKVPATRGGESLKGVASAQTVNFCFVFGCIPGQGTIANTKLIHDLTQHLSSHSKKCIIPGVLDTI